MPVVIGFAVPGFESLLRHQGLAAFPKSDLARFWRGGDRSRSVASHPNVRQKLCRQKSARRRFL